MEFELLGPLRVRGDFTEVSVTAPLSRRLLAVLLSRSNTPVSVDVLIEALWPDTRVAAETHNQLQVQVSRLRGALGDPHRIRFEHSSYTLVVHPGELDTERFETLLTEGMEFSDSNDPGWGAELLRKALALWRGEPFGDLADHPMLRDDANRLSARRVVGLEELYHAELNAGRHVAVVTDLTKLAAAHPLRERVQGLLMTALYRCGRQAEALGVFRGTRAKLVDELGVEPGSDLQKLHQAILAADPELEPTEVLLTGPPPPAQLPADASSFTGRTAQLELLHELLLTGQDASHPADTIAIAAIIGKAGVGKTTLAVRAAHQVRERFPDGQLYVDLRGTETHPVAPHEALARFLRALGVDGTAIPDDPEERAALYRSLLANRRMLVLLDNASTAAQLRPLVPGVPGCALLVTSRARITDLNGVRLVNLDILEPEQAVRLLARTVGEDRVSAQQDDAERIVWLCGYLPLAVVIAAARLAAHPHWRLSRLAAALDDEQRRLDELSVGDLEVRASLTLSYDGLDTAAQRAFYRLGLIEAKDVASWVAAALLDSSVDEAEPWLDQLVDAQLLEVASHDHTGQTRYQLHDLVRVFAKERALAEQSPGERQAAIERVIGAWLALAEQATRRVLGSTYWVAHGNAPRWPLDKGESAALLADPFAWFESERDSLVAAVEQAGALGLDEFAWDLASMLRLFLRVRGYLDDWRRTNEVAFRAAEDAGNLLGAAVMVHGLGLLHALQHRYDDALTYLDQAGAGYTKVGELRGGARLMSDLGKLYYQLGRFDEATGCFEEAVRTFEALGDLLGAAHARCDLGHHHNKLGHSEQALECVERAVHIFRGQGHLFGEAFALYVIGESLLDQGRPADARGNLDRALSVCRDAGYRFGEARTLYQLGIVYNAESQPEQAVSCLDQCLVIFDELGYRKDSAYALQQLAMVYAGQDRRPEAQAMCQRCLQTFRELDDPHGEALTLRSLGELYHTESRSALAIACLKEALLLWQKLGMVVWQARTLRSLGAVHAAAGDSSAAQLAFREATEILQRSAGSRQTDETEPADDQVAARSLQVDQPVEQ